MCIERRQSIGNQNTFGISKDDADEHKNVLIFIHLWIIIMKQKKWEKKKQNTDLQDSVKQKKNYHQPNLNVLTYFRIYVKLFLF